MYILKQFNNLFLNTVCLSFNPENSSGVYEGNSNKESPQVYNLNKETNDVLSQIELLQTELDKLDATKKYVGTAGSYLDKKLSPEDYSDPEAKQTIDLLETYKKQFKEAIEIGKSVEQELANLKQGLQKLEDKFEFSNNIDYDTESGKTVENKVSMEELKSITNHEFLSLNKNERLQYVTKNHIDSENISNGSIDNVEFNFTFDGVFNNELYMLTTAGQVLPDEVRSVKSNNIEYSRNGLSGEFFSPNGQRLLIHDGTKVDEIKIGDISEMISLNQEKVSNFILENPQSATYRDLILESVNRNIDIEFSLSIFSEQLNGLDEESRKVEIENIFTEFDRIRGENKDWNGEVLSNGKYPDEVVVSLLKEFDNNSTWKQKALDYGITEENISKIEQRNLIMYSSIDINNLPNGVNGLLEFISVLESNGNYNAVYGNSNQSKIDFTSMSVREVLQNQKERIHSGQQSATGKYQFIYKTLRLTCIKYNIDLDNQKFTPEFQDKLATLKLKERGLDRFLTGNDSLENFQLSLSKEWASLPKDFSGKSYYAGDGLNKSHSSGIQFAKVLSNLKSTV